MGTKHAFWAGVAAVLGSVVAGSLLAVLTVDAFSGSDETHVAAANGPFIRDIAVLDAPRMSSDVLPAASVREFEALAGARGGAPPELLPGEFRFSESRLLLSDLGPNRAKLYAVPTSKGEVCTLLTGRGPGCQERFGTYPVGWSLFDPDVAGAGEPFTVYGITRDDVTKVEVVVNEAASRAKLNNNGFYYRLSDAAAFPSRLIVSFRDGHTESVVFPPPPEQ